MQSLDDGELGEFASAEKESTVTYPYPSESEAFRYQKVWADVVSHRYKKHASVRGNQLVATGANADHLHFATYADSHYWEMFVRGYES